MKVRKIEPGSVFNRGNKWFFTTNWDNTTREHPSTHDSANAAKQRMREYVAHQRKLNGL